MTGDKIDIFGKSYFLNTGTVNNANSTVLDLAALMANLLTAPVNGIGAKGVTSTQLNTWNTGLVPFTFFRGTNGETTTIPKAYINYIFLDEQFKYAGGGASRVGNGTSGSGIVKDHWNVDAQLQNIPAPKNGYIFVYVSNESNLDVFFDNLQVVHKPGPLLEETHYYPFGLTMSGISSKALNNAPANKYKFNSIEQNNDFDLNMYDAFFRNLDPQIGRFWQIDPKLESAESWSPYAAMLNNPIRYSDPLGDSAAWFRPDGSFWKFVDDGKEAWSGVFYQKSTTTSTFEKDGVQYAVNTYSEGVSFQFNDPSVDVLAIKNGVESGGKVGITGIEIMSDEKANKQIDRSGVKSPEAQNSPLSYAKNQGAKKMDYGVQGIIHGDLDPKKFYLRGGVAYNVGDIGNYLWGRGMGYLGIPLGVAQMGAHYNNIFHGKDQKTKYYDFGPGTYGAPGFWDSPGDQRALINGYNTSPAVIEAYKKTQQKTSNYMQHWKPYQN
jgi:RHS repeat-associated protein